MTVFNAFKKAIDAIIVMNVAVTNIRLYPPTSPIIRNTIDRVHMILSEILNHEEAVVISESESNFVICGQLYSESDQKKYPQVTTFLEMLTKLGLTNIAFEQELGRSEIKTFLEIISRNPDDIEMEGGLEALFDEARLPHVMLDHRVYLVVDKDQAIIHSIEIRDQDIIRFVAGEAAFSDQNMDRIREMAQDPEWVQQVFHAGMTYIMKQKRNKSFEKLSEIMFHMIRTLDEISDNENKEMISKKLARSIADMDDEMLAMILTQDTDTVTEKVFNQVIDLLDKEKFERLAFTFKRLADKQAGAEDGAPETNGNVTASQAYEFMMGSIRGEQLQEHIRNRIQQEKERKEKQMKVLKEGLNSILKGDETPFLDETVMIPLPDYMEQLFLAGKGQTAEAIINRLADGLFSDDREIRDNVSEALSHISRMLIRQNQTAVMIRMLDYWLNWIKTEKSLTPAYERMCLQLQELSLNLLRDSWFTEAAPILRTFYQMHYGSMDKEDEIQRFAGEMIVEIASDNTIDRILEGIRAKDESRRQDASTCLTYLGEYSIGRLLRVLLDSRDMTERSRILQVVSENEQAPRILTEKIQKGGPWYYLRNLILLLGKAGSEDNLPALIPLLRHEDFRVQRETLNTIYNIGGKYREDLLLTHLPKADERLKLPIVDMLGALKYEASVPILADMLETKSFFTTRTSDKLKERICVALGRIGSEKAVPALQIVAEHKGILRKVYAESIRTAARDALIRIQTPGEQKVEIPAPPGPEAVPAEEPFKANETISDGEITRIPPVPDSAIKVMTPETARKRAAETEETTDTDDPRNHDTLEEEVVSMLLESIIRHARSKEFDRAEALRRQLIETDPMALTEIVRAEEVIEYEKQADAVIEEDHLAIWASLYDTLSTEEANALYYAMEESDFDPDEIIFRQGELNNRLWFIREGELKLVFTRGIREGLLKTIGPGDIIGEDTFFSFSVCTTSLITLSHVKVNYLNIDILGAWETEFPALESKLHDFCLSLERVQDILRQKGMERRTQARVKIPGVVSLQLLTSAGAPTGKAFRGGLSDISDGGLSFSIRSPNRKNVSLLLGRKLELEFEMPLNLIPKMNLDVRLNTSRSSHRVVTLGTVIGLSTHENSEYTTHIKFDGLLSEALYGASRP